MTALFSAITPATLADAIGIIGFALAGMLAADAKRIDPVGMFVLAFTTAFGGGVVRDIFIDNRPFYWIAHEEYVWMILVLTCFAPTIIHKFQQKTARLIFVWSDAIGLGFFSASSTVMGLNAGLPVLPATLMGVCTGVFGGLLRDCFLNRLPLVLSDRKPYASIAFIGSWLTVILIEAGRDVDAAIWCASLFITGTRMLTWYLDWDFVSYEENTPGNPHQMDSDKKPATINSCEELKPNKEHEANKDSPVIARPANRSDKDNHIA